MVSRLTAAGCRSNRVTSTTDGKRCRVIAFDRANSRSPSSPWIRPKPESPTPPKGSAPTPQKVSTELTLAIPDRSRRAISSPRPREKTAAPSPYAVALAFSTASSTSRTRVTVSVGPNQITDVYLLGLAVKNGDRRQRRHGKAGGRLVDPVVKRFTELLPITAVLPEQHGIQSCCGERVLQHIDRGAANELLRRAHCACCGNRHRPQRTGIAGATLEQTAIQDDPAAGERSDEEIDIVPISVAFAERQLGGAGGGRIVAEMDRAAECLGDFLLDVETPPLLQHIMGSADFVLPVPDLEGSGNADAADAGDLARLKISRDNAQESGSGTCDGSCRGPRRRDRAA